jgi:hypothetical protein
MSLRRGELTVGHNQTHAPQQKSYSITSSAMASIVGATSMPTSQPADLADDLMHMTAMIRD